MSLRSSLSLCTLFPALVLAATAATAQGRITEVGSCSSGNLASAQSASIGDGSVGNNGLEGLSYAPRSGQVLSSSNLSGITSQAI